MRFLYLLLVLSLFVKAQDKLYLLDGSKKLVKVLEIGIDDVTYAELSESGAPFANDRSVIAKSEILLIEFKNGSVEIFNRPEKNSVSTSQGLVTNSVKKPENQIINSNLVYLNTLALCNADIALFYEYLFPQKKLGLGVMAAYNFNQYATFSNFNIAVLNNGKKNYDVGAFFNFYPSAFKKKISLSYGLMVKYTSLSFSKNTGTPTNIVYAPASGGQLATMLTFGTQRLLTKNMFLKTQIGIGGFFLKGDYKEEYNEVLNDPTATTVTTYNFLLKMYVGLNLGFFL